LCSFLALTTGLLRQLEELRLKLDSKGSGRVSREDFVAQMKLTGFR
jgi:hypothetical protein